MDELFKVPELPKQGRGGRKPKFPEGAELTSDAAVAKLRADEATRIAKGRKSKRAPLAFTTYSENGRILTPHGERKAGSSRSRPKPRRWLRKLSESAISSEEDEERKLSETSEDESAVAAVDIELKRPEPESDAEMSSASDSSASFCVKCGKAVLLGQQHVQCRRCKNHFHIGCSGMAGRPSVAEKSKFVCPACCGPAGSGMGLA